MIIHSTYHGLDGKQRDQTWTETGSQRPLNILMSDLVAEKIQCEPDTSLVG